MDSQVKRVRDNRRAGGGGCHRRRRGLREAQGCGCCGALVKKIGVIRATFLTSACQESKMTKEGNMYFVGPRIYQYGVAGKTPKRTEQRQKLLGTRLILKCEN